MTTDQTENPGLEHRSVIKFLQAEKYKPCEIYIRMCNVYRKAFFSKVNIHKYTKYDFATSSRGQNDSLVKKKFQAQWSVKKVMLAVFWDIKEPIIIDFF